MSQPITFLSQELSFPNIDCALSHPNGLLAIGGDLSSKRLLLAYRNGIFPWFGENEPIMWWSPAPRAIVDLDQIHHSRSMKKFAKQTDWQVTLNTNFSSVIQTCANINRPDNGTWITPEMQSAYQQLHQYGYAHSFEVWEENELIGGLYGVAIGRMFCGESMFHKRSNASKLAFYYLVNYLADNQFIFIDCQIMTSHLQSLGAVNISRRVFKNKLELAVSNESKLIQDPSIWSPRTLSNS